MKLGRQPRASIVFKIQHQHELDDLDDSDITEQDADATVAELKEAMTQVRASLSEMAKEIHEMAKEMHELAKEIRELKQMIMMADTNNNGLKLYHIIHAISFFVLALAYVFDK